MEVQVSTSAKEMVRSFVITFLVTLIPTLFAPDLDWSVKGLLPLCLAAARTAVSYVWPGGSFGLGTEGDQP
jgi:hypothetical protein